MNFRAYCVSTFIGKASINQIKIFMLKVLKQCYISRLFCTLVYKRTKVKLLKMLHTRTHKSRMVIMIKQLMPECTSCVTRVHSGLCSNCPHWTPSVVQELTEEMAERISATIGQENITRPQREKC